MTLFVLCLLSWMGNNDSPILQECLMHHREYWTNLNKVSATIRADSPNRPENVFVRHFRLNGAAFVEHMLHDPKKPAPTYYEALYINNAKYAARALRSKEVDPLTLRYIGKPTDDLFRNRTEALYHSVFFPTSFRSRTLPEWLKTPGFQVLSLQRVTREGKQVAEMRVAYQNNIPETKETNECPFEGTVLLEPAEKWRVLEVKLRVTFRFRDMPLRQKWILTRGVYGQEVNGVQVPLRVEQEIEQESGQLKPYSTWYIDRIGACLVEDEGFRLSAYGLPEPPGVEWERPTPWYLWAGGAAFACLICGYLCKRLVVRHRS